MGPERGLSASLTLQELFRSDELVVRRVGGFSAACCVVTFDSFTDHRTLERSGYGEAFFRSREIDAVHVIPRDNDWYQYAEMEDAMAAVRAAVRSYDRVVTYGSSMGAYAAIRLAGLVGADCVLAMSPQFSIDPAVAPFEHRWLEASRKFRPVWERRLPFPTVGQAYVVYDPGDLDLKHLALLGRVWRFTSVKLAGAGHPVTGYLAETGLLERMVLEACRGALDVEALVAEAWARRTRSTQYMAVQASRKLLRSRRIELLRDASAMAPGNADIKCRLGLQLGKAGRFEEALAMHREALALEPGQPNLLLHYSVTMQRSGDFVGALAIMEDLAERSGGAAWYRRRLEALRARVAGRGKVGAAIRDAWARVFGGRSA